MSIIAIDNRKKALAFAFSDHLKLAKAALVEASTVVVSGIEDRDAMQAARERRLQIAKQRNEFKKLKESYKRPVIDEGRAIDTEYNRINRMFKDAEADLLHKEETYERHVAQQRMAALAAIVAEIPAPPSNLGKVSNAEFSDFSRVAEFYNSLTQIQIPDVDHPLITEFRDLLRRYRAEQRV